MERVFARMRGWAAGLVRVGGGTGRAVACAAVLLSAASAPADVKPVAPRLVVVAKDNTAMRCGDASHMYPVRMLKAGELLRIDAEGGGWMRCDYPSGTMAFVKADEATFEEATKTLTLSKPSALMAANENGSAPWWYLLEKPLAAGTAFASAEAVKSADGTVAGYLVPAPEGARGFIRSELLRAPTAEEAAKYSGPALATGAAASKAGEGEIVEVRPGTAMPGLAEVSATRARAASLTAKPAMTKRIEDLAVLRDMFDRVMAHDEGDAEIRTALAEFDRSINGLPNSGEDAKIRAGLAQRREALMLRGQIIETRRKVQEAGNVDGRMQEIQLAVREAERQAIYTIVGRIMPSTVYDGKRGMMLMYRVESADYSSTRTVGYVVPREGLDLLPKMGKIVGIVGDSRMDEALGLNIVAPQRVDELQVVGGKFEVVPGSTAMPIPPRPAAAAPRPTEAPKEPPTPVATPDTGDMNK